jgi:competence protein ComEC
VFCDIGQGDGTYIRTSDGIDVLVDTGPNDRIITCLEHELPYFDRTIEVMFLTHAQKDHSGGLASLVRSFSIKHIFTAPDFITIPSNQYQTLIQTIPIEWQTITQGDVLNFPRNIITVIWPPALTDKDAVNAKEVNNRALGLSIRSESKHILLLADLDATEGERALSNISSPNTILKISHHGSQYGTSKKLLLLAEPMLAVISVGKNNFYHHPHKLVIDLLKALNIPYKRTDRDGSITIPLE